MKRLTLLLLLALAAPAAAQPPKAFTQARQPGDVETDPIRCFWKTDRASVVVGEHFTVVLTCGIIDTDKIKAVPDFNQLEPSTIGLQPFEVVKGVRHEDIRSAPWRYVQYEYTVRTIAEGLFDKDLNLPPVKITYHIQSSVGGGETGRDQTYQLPAIPMHIASLVPQKATEIRDATMDTFGDIETRRVRSTGEYVAAAIAFGFAVVFLGLAVVRVVSRYRIRTPAAQRPLGLGAVLNGCLREAARVKADAAGGWTPELAARALTVLRIGGAVALERPVAQTIVDTHVPARDGQLALRKGLLRPRRALVSNATTPGTIARSLATSNGHGPDARAAATLKDLEDALATFSAARYSRDGKLDGPALDGALDTGVGALKQLRTAATWPMRMLRSVTRRSSEVLWAR
ncbi:MAG TPA: hypothetical protein VG871_16380 [Vicinamibacterales bacterium]|nr:hypothetical protein [Vicinamibacterales bacterium]